MLQSGLRRGLARHLIRLPSRRHILRRQAAKSAMRVSLQGTEAVRRLGRSAARRAAPRILTESDTETRACAGAYGRRTFLAHTRRPAGICQTGINAPLSARWSNLDTACVVLEVQSRIDGRGKPGNRHTDQPQESSPGTVRLHRDNRHNFPCPRSGCIRRSGYAGMAAVPDSGQAGQIRLYGGARRAGDAKPGGPRACPCRCRFPSRIHR